MMPQSLPELTSRDGKAVVTRVRNANPQDFDTFLQMFDRYTYAVTVAVSDAPAEEVMRMQGRAQQCRALMQLFLDALRTPTPPSV